MNTEIRAHVAPAVSFVVVFDPATQAAQAAATLTALLADPSPALDVIAIGRLGDALEVEAVRHLDRTDPRLRCSRQGADTLPAALAVAFKAALGERLVVVPPGVAPVTSRPTAGDGQNPLSDAGPGGLKHLLEALPDPDLPTFGLDAAGIPGAALTPGDLLACDPVTRPPVLALTRAARDVVTGLQPCGPWPVLALEMVRLALDRGVAARGLAPSTVAVAGEFLDRADVTDKANRLRTAWELLALRLTGQDQTLRGAVRASRAAFLIALARRLATEGAAPAAIWRLRLAALTNHPATVARLLTRGRPATP